MVSLAIKYDNSMKLFSRRELWSEQLIFQYCPSFLKLTKI